MRKLPLGLLCLFLAGTASASRAQDMPHLVDRLVLGDAASEKAHGFRGGESSAPAIRLLGQSCRIVEVPAKAPAESTEISFRMKVDPDKLNYFTLKYSGSADRFGNGVYVDGMRVGVGYGDDYPHINSAYDSNSLPGRFIYFGIVLPLGATKGKTEVELRVPTWSDRNALVGELYAAYTHTAPYLDFSLEKQGERPFGKVHPDISAEDKERHLSMFHERQNEEFLNYGKWMDEAPDRRLSIHKYSSNLRAYCSLLMLDWNPCRTPEEKRAALDRVFKSIDNWVKEYYGNYRLVLRGGHQGDWGGYFGALGEALYIVEPMINDDAVMGKEAFQRFLAEPFPTGTEDTETSLSGRDPRTGKAITRKQAWERTLKANFDFARSRLSYIWNQVFYCYMGAWKSHVGLGIIGSEHYEGLERSHRIFGEFLGIYPFLGEEVLVGPEGRDLDLFHSLFRHDRDALFTDDYTYIVAKGLAESKLDAEGKVVRRLPYGKHYYGLSAGGRLTRENGYVFNYGETANYLPEFFWITRNHPEDKPINDAVLKASLENLHGRANTRYTDLRNDGFRAMYPTTPLDERGFGLRGKWAYAAMADRMLLFASLSWHMAENPERYSGEEWAEYRQYAEQAADWTRQCLRDNFLFPETTPKTQFGRFNVDLRRVFYAPETYDFLMRTAGESKGHVHPFTDFRYYSPEELAAMRVDTKKYEQYGWSDIDCLMIDLRDGGTQVHAVLSYRAKGYGATGRVFAIEDRYSHISMLGVRSKFAYEDVFIRMNGTGHGFVADWNDNLQYNHYALQQELIPVCYQPGVGRTSRYNFETDTPYAGFPDYVETLYKGYFLAINTTRKDYQNEQTFEVRLPTDCKLTSVKDLISGKTLAVKNGIMTIPPMTAYALKLDRDDYDFGRPGPVDVVIPFLNPGNSVTLAWKEAYNAARYNVFRDGVQIAGNVAGRRYKDQGAVPGKTHAYTVQAVDGNGQRSWASYPRQIAVTPPASAWAEDAAWRDDVIGNAQGGKAKPDGSVLTIQNAGGEGFGGGNDMIPETRNQPDSLHYVHRTVDGSIELKGKLYSMGTGKVQGLMLRDSLDSEHGRYFFIGCDEKGRLFMQNRSRDSRYYWNKPAMVASPYRQEAGGMTLRHYPWFKIVRDAGTGMTSAWYAESDDDKRWIKAGEIYSPLPEVYYAGFVAAGGTPTCRFLDVKPMDAEAIEKLKEATKK